MINPSGRINESILSSSYRFDNNNNPGQEFFRLDTERNNLDISMSSVWSTPRNSHLELDKFVLSKGESIGGAANNMMMTPRMYQQQSSNNKLNDTNSSMIMLRQGSVASERSTLQHQRSSAEASEIEREVFKHSRYQNTGSNSLDKKYDPEAMKKSLMMSMQIQLQQLVNKINEKEKAYMEQEK